MNRADTTLKCGKGIVVNRGHTTLKITPILKNVKIKPETTNTKSINTPTNIILEGIVHCNLKVASSQPKIDENFAHYYLKSKAKNKWFKVLKCICKGLLKSIRNLER